jgi:hypothetical protein
MESLAQSTIVQSTKLKFSKYTFMKKYIFCLFSLFSLSAHHSFAQNWMWARSAVTAGKTDVITADVTTDRQGNIYVLGMYDGDTIHFDSFTLTNVNGNNTNNLFLTKFNSQGKVLWAKGAGPHDLVRASNVLTDSLGNIFVSGTFYSQKLILGSDTLRNTTQGGFFDNMFIAKFDPSGKEVWALNPICKSTNYGGVVKLDLKGNLFVVGSYSTDTLRLGSFQFHSHHPDGFYYGKVDNNGNPIWFRTGENGGVRGIDFDKSGALYLAGTFSSDTLFLGNLKLIKPYRGGFSTSECYFAKCDSAGNPKWLKLSASTQGFASTSQPMVDPNGNIYLGGTYNSTVKIDSTTLLNTSTHGGDNIFLSQWDTSGNLNWARQAGGLYGLFLDKIFLDLNGNPVLTGSFNSATLNFGAISLSNDSVYTYDVFICKYKSDGTALWARSAGGVLNDYTSVGCSDLSGNIYLAGSFQSDKISFGSTVLTRTADKGYDSFFLTKISDVLNVSSLHQSPWGAHVYPNPMSFSATIKVDTPESVAFDFILYNQFGQEVRRISHITSNSFNVQRESLAAGMYFFILENDQKNDIAKGKLIIH